MINTNLYTKKLENLKVIFVWLIEGYDTNLFLKNKLCPPSKEWLIQHYNVDENYFKKHSK